MALGDVAAADTEDLGKFSVQAVFDIFPDQAESEPTERRLAAL